jgi:hypothetical protein
MANLGEAVSPPPPPAPHHHPSHAAAGSVEKQRRQQQEEQQQQRKSSSTSSNSYVEELKCAQRVSISVDLVLAAKRELGFLRTIESLPFLHGGPAIYHAIRRYQEFWMPLAVTISADQGLQLQATRPSSSSSTASSSPSPSSSSSDVVAAARVPNGDHHAAAHGISSKCQQQQQLDLLLLPPLDVQWVWHCHCLNPVSENHIHKITIVVHHHLIPLKMIHE